METIGRLSLLLFSFLFYFPLFRKQMTPEERKKILDEKREERRKKRLEEKKKTMEEEKKLKIERAKVSSEKTNEEFHCKLG